MQSAKPPFRLVLGRDASKRIEAELNTQMQELTAWRQAAIDADYQAGE